MTRVLYLPEQDISVLLIPGCADAAIAAAYPAGDYRDEPVEGSRVFAVIRDPLERFQDWHRRNWIERRTELPPELRKLGYQRDWPIALVAEHTSALVSASDSVQGLVQLGEYSAQRSFWPEARPEFLLYDQLEFDWSTQIGGNVTPQLSPARYKYAPAALLGDVKARLQHAYAADLAVYGQVSSRARAKREELHRMLAGR